MNEQELKVERRVRSISAVTIGASIIITILAGSLGWAARELLSAPEDTQERPSYALVFATEGTLGRNLNVAAQAKWKASSTLLGRQPGTLTSIPGGREGKVDAGDVLYTVDLQPVYILPGQVPAFRDMSKGLEGEDIKQLQAFLFDYYHWDLMPDGKFGDSTETLLKYWQKDNGLEVTGIIPAGQILFTPQLPVHVSWEDDVHVGSELAVGTALVKVFSDTPTFTMPLPEGQLRAAHEGDSVELEYEGHHWQAKIGVITENIEEHSLVATLEPIEGHERICESECESIPAAGVKGINATVVLVPEERGTQVPINAIRVNAQGKTLIVDEDGTQHPVEVRVSVGGQAIVDGIPAGMRIRVWGDSDGKSRPAQPTTPDVQQSADTGKESGQ